MQGEYIRIVPPPGGAGPMLTRGTKVFVGDVEVKGVFKIEITADLDSVWRATVHFYPGDVPEIITLANVKPYYCRPWRARLRNWWQGATVGRPQDDRAKLPEVATVPPIKPARSNDGPFDAGPRS